jgi:hypothetical protein
MLCPRVKVTDGTKDKVALVEPNMRDLERQLSLSTLGNIVLFPVVQLNVDVNFSGAPAVPARRYMVCRYEFRMSGLGFRV